jgi:hypothetical protein
MTEAHNRSYSTATSTRYDVLSASAQPTQTGSRVEKNAEFKARVSQKLDVWEGKVKEIWDKLKIIGNEINERLKKKKGKKGNAHAVVGHTVNEQMACDNNPQVFMTHVPLYPSIDKQK